MEQKEWDEEFARLKKKLAPLGLSFGLDEKARDALASALKREKDGERKLGALEGNDVVVFGNAPSGKKALARLEKAGALGRLKVIAADNAVKLLLARGMVPFAVCTDLDGDLKAIAKAGSNGAVVVVHAHGDNLGKIADAVRKLRGCALVGTTQVKPVGKVRNYFGFTDGDRALFLAKKFGARRIGFAGFSFRKRKYAAAKRLVGLLKKEKKEIYDLGLQKEFGEFVR